ncbi:SpoIIE family protein phosphatase/ATP-binding protein [Kitasatospora cystarginea]|uniref:SpoIIE family protein phosphatase/ATP-binding protein n=1 Tax=Kitasatospora cystarginea TaxID=58350 RepID=A0ABP5Q9F5_9ACTN
MDARQPQGEYGGAGPPARPPATLIGVHSIAGQVFVLQVVIVLLLIVAAVVELLAQAQRDSTQEARNRSLAVAQTFAHSPGMLAALAAPDPTAILQPRAEAARQASGMDFIVVMTPEGIRLTHPNPSEIGKHYIGTIAPAVAGGTVTETYVGTLGPSVRSVVPVARPGGSVAGLVSAGITISKVSGVADRQLPLMLGSAAAALALATGGAALVSRRLRRQTRGLGPAGITRMYEHHDAVLHAVREGVLIVDGERRLTLANDEARRLLDLPADAEGRAVTDLGLDASMAGLLMSGETATDQVYPAGNRLLAVNLRLTKLGDGPPDFVATLRDTTELQELAGRADVARQRLKLLYDAGAAIGTTLDVVRTAEELTEFAVPRFADFATVDLADPVLRGDEPTGTNLDMRRTAVHGLRPNAPLYRVGDLITWSPATPQARGFRTGHAVLEPDLRLAPDWQAQDPDLTARMMAYGFHSLITVPLQARGIIMGMANFWRSAKPEPFEEDDLSVAEELATRAALCVDNARRYTREHSMAVTLQRSLLPRDLPAQDALDIAHRYLPAHSRMGGDWFDVIPLPGARVALVVGDVVGHGVHAAATMGRLRTAVHNFSALDLPPDELLGHLDELVHRIDQEETAAGDRTAVTGATCLYAVYDAVSGECALARAGHLPPALVRPDGTAEFPELPAGPPLGLAGLPFETAHLRLPEGSRLVLYTDGLVERRNHDIETGLELLRRALAEPGRSPEEICDAVLDALLPAEPSDDIALLVARTRVLADDRVASWDVPTDPAAVSHTRAAVTRQLDEWDLADLAFNTELILSELTTNAIRHAGGPIRVRLLRDRQLTCEVSDASSTSPHLRYAASTDEGGRGLFLVAQFAEHWGTRYTATGKVIWASQTLPQP